MRIDLILFDGLDELDLVAPLEVLRGAALAGADLDVRLAGRADLAPVTGTFGMAFAPEVVFTPGEADLVVVPGGGWALKAERSAWGEVQRGDWLPPLADAAASGASDRNAFMGTSTLTSSAASSRPYQILIRPGGNFCT